MNNPVRIAIILSTILLSACGGQLSAVDPTPTPVAAIPVEPLSGMPQGTDGYPWWNDTVFYEIFVRSYYDSDGDGVGDFNGIIEKLDYLNDGDPQTTEDLGITGLWLMPIQPSPSYHGYDVTDYYAVNPDYGSMEDFKRMLDEAHQRGIRVIIDLVINHTSSNHPWFIQSRDPASPYRDWYIWEQEKPAFVGPWMQPVWHGTRWGYYYALFWDRMPDLNYSNPVVTARMLDVSRFWLEEVGVDGFRIDAAKHLIEEGALQENTESTHTWFAVFRPYYKAVKPDAMTVGEFFGDDLGVIASYTSGDELDLAFNFGLAESWISSARSGNSDAANGGLKLTYKLLPDMQYATFLTNHDQDRVMSQLDGQVDQARVAASLLLTSPGVPFIYYGEEIGLEGRKPDENIRRPMQWTAEKFAGFSTKFPWRSPGQNYKSANVALMSEDANSLLSHYRSLISIRNQHAALRVGETTLLETGHNGLFGMLRTSKNESLLVLVNLTGEAITDYQLAVPESRLSTGEFLLVPVLISSQPPEFSTYSMTVANSGGIIPFRPLAAIQPYETIILQLHEK